MDPITISAASGLRSRMESLDMLANNLANTETGGYKTDREFYNLYVAPEAVDEPAQTLPVIERPWTDFSQGVLRTTGAPFDLALSGRGFFTVKGPAGDLYTRNGSFRVSPAGLLVSAEGYPVRNVNGNSISLAGTGAVEISPDGTIRENGQPIGQIRVADVPDQASLVKQGTSYFRSNQTVGTAPGTEIHQGKLENSNVGPAESAVRLVSVLRQFEMLQKAVSLGSQMNRKAVEEVARVGS
ncbi:MAG: flagellar basal-body rod protein FlgF [Bryobacteraceae bacterium]